MPPAVLIARLIGPLFVTIGVGVLINAQFYVGSVIEAVHSPTLVYMSGVASMLAGLAILNAYRAWTADWRVIVTILGWLMAIGGIVRIVLPQVAATVAPELYSGPTALMITGAIVLVLGGILTVKGYRA
jgi:uncharacterized membrane protein